MRPYPQLGRFTAFLLAFMLSMLGLVLAENLISLFIFWELTGLTSFLLIGYTHEDATARRAGTSGPAGYRRGRSGDAGRFRAAGRNGWDLQLARTACQNWELGRFIELSLDLGFGLGGSIHEVRAVSLSFLAAERDGGAHSGVGLSPLGHHGQGRGVPASPDVPSSGWNRGVECDVGWHWRGHRGLFRDGRRPHAGISSKSWLIPP